MSSSSKSVFLPPSQTRLVTIAAHVDHGKTTLADSLIESNGLISERLAGTLRYLDSDPEEQRRGITMRSSAIGLQHLHEKQQQNYILHLVDSPGHADFSAEVSSALTACDACLLVIDAVEGMGPRTHQVFREAYRNQLVPILVVNKIDRLCLDLGLTPTEAYLRIRSLLETVNAAASAMLTSAQQQNERDEDLWMFEPAKNNVVFASALFGWGFTCQSLARSLFRHKTLPIKPILLKQYIFGDFKIKDDKILKWKHGSEDLPVFAEYALQPLWSIYEGVAAAAAAATLGLNNNSSKESNGKKDARIKAETPGMDQVLVAMSTGATGSQAPSSVEEMQTTLTRTGASTEDAVLRSLLRRYRPLSDSVLDAVCEYAPSPEFAASKIRSHVLALQTPNESSDEFERIQKSVAACDAAAEAPVVAYVCKFMATDKVHVRDPDLPEEENNLILGLARVLSGRLKSDEEYYLMGPKHSSSSPSPPKKTIRLYLLMGSSFVRVDEVPAGHLCAIYNLEDIQLKTVTICDSDKCMPLVGLERGIRPLVKVNVEPQNAADADDLERGLMKLSLADSAVEVTATARGERILACLGELHLGQSILDLKRVYCGREIELRISDPLVEFGETTDWFENEMDYSAFYDDESATLRQTKMPPYNEEEGLAYAKHGRTRSIVSGRSAAVSLRVVPLAEEVHKALQEGRLVEGCEDELLRLGKAIGCSRDSSEMSAESVLQSLKDSLCSLNGNGSALVESAGLKSGFCTLGVESALGEVHVPQTKAEGTTDKEIEEGSDGATENGADELAIVGADEYQTLQSRVRKRGFGSTESNGSKGDSDEAARRIWNESMKGSAVAGFQMAMRAGAICEEPIRNVLVLLEGVEVAISRQGDAFEPAKPLSGGMVVSALKSGIRCAMLTRPARLMERYLRLTLHSSLTGLGALYSVLSKRRGRVLDDSMVDGTDLIMITAMVPQAEAFGLAPELYGKTSGEVTAPEMNFSHWARLDVDPFWIPTTEEEREDFGELQNAGDTSTGLDNTALKYIRKVRQQKGLVIDSSRTVIAAEKQRTLKK